MVTAVTIDIHDVKETVVRKGGQPFQQPFCAGADQSWLEEPSGQVSARNRKSFGIQGLSSRGRFLLDL